MDAQTGDPDIRMLLADIESLARQASKPPETPLSDEASKALGRIYSRFIKRVYAFCLRRFQSSLPFDHLIDDFVETLFFRFVRSADGIKLQSRASLADVEKQLLVCFHGHAGWVLRDLLRKAATVEQLTDALMRDIGMPRNGEDIPASPEIVANRLKLRTELDKLDPRARDVLLTSYQHQDLNTHQFVLPEEVREDLCKRCNFATPNALAQYRLRRIADLRLKISSVA